MVRYRNTRARAGSRALIFLVTRDRVNVRRCRSKISLDLQLFDRSHRSRTRAKEEREREKLPEPPGEIKGAYIKTHGDSYVSLAPFLVFGGATRVEGEGGRVKGRREAASASRAYGSNARRQSALLSHTARSYIYTTTMQPGFVEAARRESRNLELIRRACYIIHDTTGRRV